MSKAVKLDSLRPLRSGDNLPRCSAVDTGLFIDTVCIVLHKAMVWCRLGPASWFKYGLSHCKNAADKHTNIPFIQ